ncbi:hypothetical protein M9Y10_033598 [Tritrichomonas musculus]|uniref:Uncharacterized protein n=1 Tax=Tritrichomonas musculus TaxID=1915356 RepID=A0ABR2KDD8_9EUKA
MNKTVDVIERLQRLRKIMTEEVNLEKQVCKMTSKRAINPNNTIQTINRLSPPIPQEQIKSIKKSSRNSVSRSRKDEKYDFPHKTAPIRKKKSPELRKSSAQKILSKEKTAIQTITECKNSRSRSQTRSKHSSQPRTQSPSSHRRMKNVEVQTRADAVYNSLNRRLGRTYSKDSEKRISTIHQDRIKRHFFGIWLRQRLRAARQRMDDSLNRRTSRNDHYYDNIKQKSRREIDQTRNKRITDDFYEYDYNEKVNYKRKSSSKRNDSLKQTDNYKNSSTKRKRSASSRLRNKGYQTQYIIETDKCKTKIKREPTNVLESEITRLLEAKKQHVRVPSPIMSKTTHVTKTVKRTRRKPSKTNVDVPEKRNKATETTKKMISKKKRYYEDDNGDEEDYDEIEANNYIQKIRQQKLLQKFEEERKKQIKANVNSHYGYIPKSDLEMFDENDRILSKPTIPRRNQYNQIIDQIEEQQKHQIQMNYFNNESNSLSSSNSIGNNDSESLSNIQKVQNQNQKSEDVSSDILNMSFSEEKHAAEINSFDVNDLGIKKNRKKKETTDLLPHSSDEDINLIPPESLIPKNRLNKVESNQKVAKVITNIQKVKDSEQRNKEKQEIQARLDKIKLENYLFTSSEDVNINEEEEKEFTTTRKQEKIIKTTIIQNQNINDEKKECEKEDLSIKKTQDNILNERFNSDDVFSSEQIEKIVNDEFSSEIANRMNRFSSEQSSIITSTPSVIKPPQKKQYLYSKTTKTTITSIHRESDFEEEEEDFDINKYLSDEFKENSKSNENNIIEDEYSDIKVNKELAKKIENNISEELSFGLSEEKKTQSNNIISVEVDDNLIIEEEEEEEMDENKIDLSQNLSNSVSKSKDDGDSEKILLSNIDSLIDSKSNEVVDNKNNDLKESNEINDIMNNSSDIIADLINDHSSDFEHIQHEPIKNANVDKSDEEEKQDEQEKDNKNDDGSSLDIEQFVEDDIELNKQESNKEIEKENSSLDIDEFIEDEEEKNKQEASKESEKEKENSSLDIDEFIEDEEGMNKQEESDEKKSDNSDIALDEFVDDFNEETKPGNKGAFPFKVDFEIGVDELSSDNLEEKPTLDYKLLPPTTLEEALEISKETETNENKSDDDFIDDEFAQESDDNKDKSKEKDKSNEKTETLSDMDIDIDDFNESPNEEEKKETEKEKSESDVDILIDDFNEDDEPNKKQDTSKDNQGADSGLDIDEFIENDEEPNKQEATSKENQNNDSGLDIDEFIDDDEEQKKQETSKENKSNNSSIDIDEFIDDDEEQKKQEANKVNKSNSDMDVDVFVDDFNDDDDEVKTSGTKSSFPFKVDFEIGVDELSSDNLEEKPTLDYKLLPPTTLEEALEISKETETTKTETNENKSDDDFIDDIKDISISDNEEKQKTNTQEDSSNVDIEIDDFHISDDEKKSDVEDINIDDISIPSEKEEQKKSDVEDINIDDISIPSEKEEPKKSDSDDINIQDISINSDNDEKNKNGFPFKVDYIVNVDELSSSGIEERPKLDIKMIQKPESKVLNNSSEKEIEISIEADFEIESDDNNKINSNSNSNLNTNNVSANNSSRHNQGIDNIADDFFIESDNDINIDDFKDDDKDENASEKEKESDVIDVDLDGDDVLSENDDQKEQKQENNNDIELSSDFDMEIDIGDSL